MLNRSPIHLRSSNVHLIFKQWFYISTEQHERQDLGHAAAAAGEPQELALQLFEGNRQFDKRRAIAQCAGLALDHGQIMPPVIDRSPASRVGLIDDARVFAQDLPLGRHDYPLGLDPHADRPVGERGGHTVVTLEADEADRRDPLGVLDEAVEGPAQRHQAADLLRVHIGDRAGQAAVLDLAPLRDALFLEPDVECIVSGAWAPWYRSA